jgi:selenocysteine lyase/cysteine desulfurase
MERFSRQCGAAAGRGSYQSARDASVVVDTARRRLAQWIGADSPQGVSIQPSCTTALNIAIHGLLRPGDHVVTTAAEHNAVLRPLRHSQQYRGIDLTVVPCDRNGRVSAERVLEAVTPGTKMVAVAHASNVTGVVQPIAIVGEALRDHPAALLCDAAQTFGHLPIDVAQLGVDLLAAPGHKGSGGPLGTACLFVSEAWREDIMPLIQGGTGSQSESLEMPAAMPEKLESGILNVPALAGWLECLGEESIRRTEVRCQRGADIRGRLCEELANIDGVRVLGGAEDSAAAEPDLPLVSVLIDGVTPSDAASILDLEFGIEVRSGLHCAAEIHRYLGTEAGGTVRISGGHSTRDDEIDAVIDAVSQVAEAIHEQSV